MRRIGLRHLLSLIAALIAGVVAFHFVPEPLRELTRAEFMAEVRAGHVRRVEIRDQEVIIAESATRGEFRTAFDRRDDGKLRTSCARSASRSGLPDRRRGFSDRRQGVNRPRLRRMLRSQ